MFLHICLWISCKRHTKVVSCHLRSLNCDIDIRASPSTAQRYYDIVEKRQGKTTTSTTPKPKKKWIKDWGELQIHGKSFVFVLFVNSKENKEILRQPFWLHLPLTTRLLLCLSINRNFSSLSIAIRTLKANSFSR